MNDKVVERLDGPMLARDFRVDAKGIIDEETRTIQVSFSSEEPYTRRLGFREPWVEKLGHKNDEVNLMHLNSNAPVLFNHDREKRENHIGVVTMAWVENGKGKAEIRISKTEEVNPIWERIKEGTLQNISVGYSIGERMLTKQAERPGEIKEYRVTRWNPKEISVVTIPADDSVGIGRNAEFSITRMGENIEVDEMPLKKNGKDQAVEDSGTRAAEGNSVDVQAIEQRAAEQAQVAERNRVAEIYKRSRQASLDESFADELVSRGVSVADAQAAIMDQWSKKGASMPVSSDARMEMGEDQADKFTKGAESWLMAKSGMGELEADNNYNNMSLRELLRESLVVKNVAARGLSDEEMLVRATHGQSDFPEITRNAASKSLMRGYDEADVTYQEWAVIGNLSDFKTAYRVDFGGFDNLPEVKRGGEVLHTSSSDRAETIQLITYAAKFGLDRQTIIDDDVSAFTLVPMRFGEAAAGAVNAAAYGILTANGNMSDGVALFHTATHGNLEGSGSAITTTSVSSMRTLMAKQKRTGVSSSGRAANIRLTKIVCPVAVEAAALTVRESQYEVGASTRNNTTPNVERNRFEVISDATLDANDATAWYGMSDRQTVEVAFLNGRRQPTLVSMPASNTLGTEWMVYMDAGAAALDWRTMAKNPGA